MKDTKIVYELVNTAATITNPTVVDEKEMTPAEAVELNGIFREKNVPARWIRKAHNSASPPIHSEEESPAVPTEEAKTISDAGQYVFNPELIEKRLKELKEIDDQLEPSHLDILDGVSMVISEIVATLRKESQAKPHFTNEEFREVVRHLNMLIKKIGEDRVHDYGEDIKYAATYEMVYNCTEFLESKNYFNFNQSDLV